MLRRPARTPGPRKAGRPRLRSTCSPWCFSPLASAHPPRIVDCTKTAPLSRCLAQCGLANPQVHEMDLETNGISRTIHSVKPPYSQRTPFVTRSCCHRCDRAKLRAPPRHSFAPQPSCLPTSPPRRVDCCGKRPQLPAVDHKRCARGCFERTTGGRKAAPRRFVLLARPGTVWRSGAVDARQAASPGAIATWLSWQLLPGIVPRGPLPPDAVPQQRTPALRGWIERSAPSLDSATAKEQSNHHHTPYFFTAQNPDHHPWHVEPPTQTG